MWIDSLLALLSAQAIQVSFFFFCSASSTIPPMQNLYSTIFHKAGLQLLLDISHLAPQGFNRYLQVSLIFGHIQIRVLTTGHIF